MNKIWIFIFVIPFFLVFSIYPENNTADLDKLITEIYLKNGFEQLKTGNFEEAFSLSDIALSFNENSSDAYFIRAVSSRNLNMDLNPIYDLSSAIISDNWNYYNEITARAKLSEYMYLNGNIEEAYLNLLPFSHNLSFSPEFTELFIRISLNLGKVDAAVISAENILEVDPEDSYSQLLMAKYSVPWLTRVESILIDGDPSNYVSKDVFQYIMKIKSDCNNFNELYLNRWGEDRFYKINNTCKNIDLLPELLSELYPDNTVVNFDELLWIYSLFEDESSKQLIVDRLSSIIITIQYDSDSDGFIDTEALYRKGNLVSFKFDSNHDDNFDYFVELNGTPFKLKVITKNATNSFIYRNYPYLITVIKSDKNTLSEYQLIPYRLSFGIIFVPVDFTKEIPHILENIEFPDNDILTASSASKNITNLNENLISNYSVIGLNESIEKVFNSEGVKIVERHYRGSVLISVYKDFDSDGVFDTIYEYNNGELLKISFDENNNGISEYVENYKTGLISTWDFNEDGILDSREYSENGIKYRELSSKLDGEFDIFLEITSEME